MTVARLGVLYYKYAFKQILSPTAEASSREFYELSQCADRSKGRLTAQGATSWGLAIGRQN